MNMTTTFTERDKKLLSGLSAVLIAAVFGLAIIRPLHEASSNMKQQIADNEARVEEVRGKVEALKTLRVTNENAKAKLEIAQREVYPTMRSKDIDRILSDMVERYGLSTRNLQIVMPEEQANVLPFLALPDTVGSNPDGLEALSAASVAIEVTGSRNGLNLMVDEIAGSTSGIRIDKLTWTQERDTTDPVTGVTTMQDVLKMELSVYMSSSKKQTQK